VETRLASERHAVDVRADFDPAKPSALTFLQLAYGARDILCADHPDPGEVARGLLDHGSNLFVMTSARNSASSGGSQCDSNSGIGDSTCMSVPSSTMSDSRRSTSQDRASIFAEYLAADHHRGLVTCRQLDARPPPVPLGIGSQSRRHNMGVNIDHSAHRVSPCCSLRAYASIRTTLRNDARPAVFTLQTGLIVSYFGVKTSFESVTMAVVSSEATRERTR